MNNFSHLLNVGKKVILETFSLIGLVDVLMFAGCFLVFSLFYFLACIFAQVRFFIPQLFKFLAFFVLLVSPLLLFWMGQNVLYKNEVTYKVAKRLEYSPTYLVDGVVRNVGKYTIGHCYLMIEGLRNPSKRRNALANAILPLKSYKYRINGKITPGASVSFREVIQDFPYAFYRESIQCYGGK